MPTLSEELQVRMDAFNGSMELYNSKKVVAIENMVDTGKIYTDEAFIEVLDGQMSALKVEFETNAQAINFRINEIIKNEKAKHFKKNDSRSDKAAQVSNALRFLEIEGSGIDDEKAFLILKDFMDDVDTMTLFKNVIEKQLDPNSKEDIQLFNKTFGQYNEKVALLNTFHQMEAIAKDLFTRPLTTIQHSILRGREFVHQHCSSYTDTVDQGTLIDLGEIIENMTGE